MPIYEYRCLECSHLFEAIHAPTESVALCPKCKKLALERLFPLVSIGGKGDLRESTLHGCHEHGPLEHSHDRNGEQE